jgi:hypothetical protein
MTPGRASDRDTVAMPSVPARAGQLASKQMIPSTISTIDDDAPGRHVP